MRYHIEHLTVSYPATEFTAVQDVSIEIREGDFIGLLGSSGSGKSQLSLALSGLNTFYHGDIAFAVCQMDLENGISILNSAQNLKSQMIPYVSYIFQNPSSYFNPVLKIKNQLPGVDLARSEDWNNYGDLLELNEREKFLNSYPYELSGGELQRIAVIFGLLRKPVLVVADEMESSLGERLAIKTLDVLKSYQEKTGAAVIWITHDQVKAKELCNRIWLMDAGKIVYDGDPENYPLPHLPYQKVQSGHEPVLLELKNISKRWDGHTFLDKIHFEVHKNEIVGIIGDSGSGKSTLAKIMANIERPDSGEIVLNQKQIIYPSEFKGIVYAFQDSLSACNPRFSCRKILNEAIHLGAAHWTLNSLLEFGHLPASVLDKKAIELSGGMRQRLNLMRCIATEPKLLILDETLNGIHLDLQMQLIHLIHQYMQSSQMSLVLVSHQIDLVRAICHRSYQIREGQLYT